MLGTVKRMAGGTDMFSASDWRQDGDVLRGSERYPHGAVCPESLEMRDAAAEAFSTRMGQKYCGGAPNGHVRVRPGSVEKCGEVLCPDGYCEPQFGKYDERGEPCYGSYGEHFGGGLFYGDYGGVMTPARYATTVPHLAPAMPVGAIALYTGTEGRCSRQPYGACSPTRARYADMVPRSEPATPYGAIAVYTGTEPRSSIGTYRDSARPMFSGGEYDYSTVQVGNAVMDPAVAAIIRDGIDFGDGPVCSVAGWDGLSGVGSAAGVNCSVADRNGVSEPVSGDVNRNATDYEAEYAAVERVLLKQRMTVGSTVAAYPCGTDPGERYETAMYSAPCVDTSSCVTDVRSVDSGNGDDCYSVPNGPADGICASVNNGEDRLCGSAELEWSVPMDDALVKPVCDESVPQLSVCASYEVSGCSVAYPDGTARSGAGKVQVDSVRAENVMLGLERCSYDETVLCDSPLGFERSKDAGNGADVVTEAVPSALPERCDDTESVISFGDFGGSDAVASGDLRVAGVPGMVPGNTEHDDCMEYFEVPFVREGDGGNCVAFESVDEGNAEVSLGGDCDSGHEAFGAGAVHHDMVTTKCSDGPGTQWLQSSGTVSSVGLQDEAYETVLTGSVQDLLRAVDLERMLVAFPSVMHAWLGSGALACERSVDSGSRMNGEELRFGVIVPDGAEDDASVTGGSVRKSVRATVGDSVDLACDGNMSKRGDGVRIDTLNSTLCYRGLVPCKVTGGEACIPDVGRRAEVPVEDSVLKTSVHVTDRGAEELTLHWSVLTRNDSMLVTVRDDVCVERAVPRYWDPGGPDGALLMARSVSNGTHCVCWSLGKSGSTTELSFDVLRDSTLPSVSVPDWREVAAKLCLASSEVEVDATTTLDGGTRIPDPISVVWNREHAIWYSLRVEGLVRGQSSSWVCGDTVAKPCEVIVCDASDGRRPLVLDSSNASGHCGSERLCSLDHGPFRSMTFRSMTMDICAGMDGMLEAALDDYVFCKVTECRPSALLSRTNSFSALARKCSLWLDSLLQPEGVASVPGVQCDEFERLVDRMDSDELTRSVVGVVSDCGDSVRVGPVVADQTFSCVPVTLIEPLAVCDSVMVLTGAAVVTVRDTYVKRNGATGRLRGFPSVLQSVPDSAGEFYRTKDGLFWRGEAGSVPGVRAVHPAWMNRLWMGRLHQYLSVTQCIGVCATVISLEGGGLRLVGEPSPAPSEEQSVTSSLRDIRTTVITNAKDENRSLVVKRAWRTDADRDVGFGGLHC